MEYALAVVGSITTAVRLKKRIVEMGACTPAVVHTPSSINNGGCSYSLRFKEQNIPVVKSCANKSNINIKGIYIENKLGGESEYRAVPG